MAKKKLTKEFRAELMVALLLAADRFKRGRTRYRGICAVLCGLKDRGQISSDARSYLTQRSGGMIGSASCESRLLKGASE